MRVVDPKLCIVCRGAKLLCGMAYCPIIVKNIYYVRSVKYSDLKEFEGSSPPSVFVGRVGYPYVYVGPLVPPYKGDTSILDLPEAWVDKKIEDIIDFRSSLIRGKTLVNVKELRRYERVITELQELALSERPVDSEVRFIKPIKPTMRFDERVPPLGPSGVLREFRITSNIYVNRKLEKAYYDTDLKALEAIRWLYSNGVPITLIQRALSVGALGTARWRRLVPTRWAITAVDDAISRYLIKKVKEYPIINKFLVFHRKVFKNTFIAIIAPRHWSYEWIEAWYPQTTWNPSYDEVEFGGDYEGISGRTTYAEPGGCYYAARLAVTEYLCRIRRQGTAILWREIYTGFNLPIGVWFVRENLRAMFKSQPRVFDSITEVLEYLKGVLTIDIGTWVRQSKLVRDLLFQESLSKYFKGLRK